MRAILAKFGCFILFILFLPLFAIFIGPLLVLAAFRGYQSVGPITLDTVRYGPAGRVGALILGLVIWILVWGSLAWLAIASSLPAPTVVNLPPQATATATPAPIITPTPPPPTFTPLATGTPTPLPATTTPTESPTVPPATGTTTPTATPTELFNETLATNTPTTTPELQAERAKTLIPTTPPATLTFTDRQAAIAAVEEGNLLLRQAINLANEENIQKLETVWHGTALSDAQEFATELYDRYASPFNAQFEYISPPAIGEPNLLGETVIISREKWSYGGPTKTKQEAFEFIYTLNQKDGRWLITDYTYRNLSLPTPTTTPTATPNDQS